MARIYEYPDPKHIPGAAAYVEGTGRAGAVGGLVTFVVIAVLVALALFGWAFYRGGDAGRAFLAAGIGMTALLAVFLLWKALRRPTNAEQLGKLPSAAPDRRVELVLEQLDDRFAIFRGVVAGGGTLDHLIVGPTGVFVVVDSAGAPEQSDEKTDARALEQCRGVTELLKQLLPEARPEVQAVVCIPPGSGRVERDSQGVWVVPTEKLAAALIKRSGQEGAIASNVNETGAFSSDALQSAAIEQVLSTHWTIPTRKRATDFLQS